MSQQRYAIFDMKIFRFKLPGFRAGRHRRGITSLEILFAVTLVFAASMMYVALVPSALKTERMMANHQQATSLLQHKVDQLRGVGYGRLTYDELKDAGIIDATPTSSPYRFNTVDRLTDYYKAATGTITITDFDTNNKRVVLTLTWTGMHARQANGTLSVTALIARG